MTEVWKAVPGFEGLYEVSDQGRVRSLDRTITDTLGRVRRLRGKLLAMAPHPAGYSIVHLWAHDRREWMTLHECVMLAFVGPRPDGMEVCHNNGQPQDNRLANLRYDTPSANRRDKARHGTQTWGERHPVAKLSNAAVADIRRQYHPARRDQMAAAHGVSPDHLRKIASGERRARG